MPRLDGTGPAGKGPMTGRKQGVCKPVEEEKEKKDPKPENLSYPRRGLKRANIKNRNRF